MGPYGSQNFKTLSLLQIEAESFQTFLIFPNCPHKNTFGIFTLLKIEILTIFFFVFLNMGPYGCHNFKTILRQITAESFQTSPDAFSQYPHKITLGIF